MHALLLTLFHVDHPHQITSLSHSINAIGPAPHWGGRKREHRSIVFATITLTLFQKTIGSLLWISSSNSMTKSLLPCHHLGSIRHKAMLAKNRTAHAYKAALA
jgi:hypothetical protein